MQSSKKSREGDEDEDEDEVLDLDEATENASSGEDDADEERYRGVPQAEEAEPKCYKTTVSEAKGGSPRFQNSRATFNGEKAAELFL